MICPVCELGTLEPKIDEKGYRYNICDDCAVEVVTPKDSRYNKAKSTARRKQNGDTEC